MFFARLALGCVCVSAAAVAQQYVISTVAGGAPPPTPVTAVNASIGAVFGVTTDSAGNVYFTASGCVLKVDQNGVLTRVAGTSRDGYSGDAGPAVDAQVSPTSTAVDGAGNLYITDGSARIRKVSANGVITTIAGNGTYGFSGDGGAATNAQISYSSGLASDAAGNLYFAD